MKGYLLIIGPLVVIISVLITLNAFFRQSLQMEMAEQFNKQQLLLSKSIANNIEAYFYYLKDDILHLSNMLSKSDIKNGKTFKWLTSKMRKSMKIRADIGLLNAGGDTVFYEGSRDKLKKDALYISEYVKNMDVNSAVIIELPPSIYVLSPIGSNGSVEGVLFMSLAVEDIAKHFVSDIKSGSRGYSWMMDKEGTLLYHPTQPGMSQSLS